MIELPFDGLQTFALVGLCVSFGIIAFIFLGMTVFSKAEIRRRGDRRKPR